MRSISLTYPMTLGGKPRAMDASDFVRRTMSRTCAACDGIWSFCHAKQKTINLGMERLAQR